MNEVTIDLVDSSASAVSSDLIAGLSGAVLGGLISLVTAWYFCERGQRDQRLALAISITTKMHRLADEVHKACSQINRAVAHSPDIPTWGSLRPFVGFGRVGVVFESSELALFSRQTSFIQDLYEAAAFHQLLLDVMAEFSVRREALTARMSELSIESENDGARRTTTIPPESKKFLDPMIANVSGLADHLVEMSGSLDRVLETANRVSGALRSVLNDRRFDLELAFGRPDIEGTQS